MDDQCCRKRIMGNFKDIMTSLDGEVMAEHLYEDGVFDSDEEELVSEQKSREDKNVKFLRVFMRKKNMKRAYKILVDTLRDKLDEKQLADKLDAYNPGTLTTEEAADFRSAVIQSESLQLLQRQLWNQAEQLIQMQAEVRALQARKNLPDNGLSLGQSEQIISWKSLIPIIYDYMKNVIKQQLSDRNNANNSSSPTLENIKSRGTSLLESMAKFKPKFGKTKTADEGSMSIVQDVSKDVAVDIVNFLSDIEPSDTTDTQNEYKATMRRLATELLEQKAAFFKETEDSFDSSNLNRLENIIRVRDELFKEGNVNWGRILALCTFMGWVAKRMTDEWKEEKHMTKEELVAQREKLSNVLVFYLQNELGKWIYNNGGWEYFLKLFQSEEASTDSCIKTVLTTIGVATILTLVFGTGL